MVEARSDVDLSEKPFGDERRRQFRVQHLHRHLPAVFHILGEVHRRHSARTNFSLNGVAACEGGRDPRGNIGHEFRLQICDLCNRISLKLALCSPHIAMFLFPTRSLPSWDPLARYPRIAHGRVVHERGHDDRVFHQVLNR